eukprot:2297341-Prymnesium_polylepis.1
MPSKLTCPAGEGGHTPARSACAASVREHVAHLLEQCVEQITALQLRHPLHLDEFVERIGDCEHRIVAKRVVLGDRRLRVVSSTREWGAGVVVVVLSPEVSSIVVSLKAAPRFVARPPCRRRKLHPPGHKGLVQQRVRREPPCENCEETSKHAVAQLQICLQWLVIFPQLAEVGTQPQISVSPRTRLVGGS